MERIDFPLLGNSGVMALAILTHVFMAFVAVGGIALSVGAEWVGWRKQIPAYDRLARTYMGFIGHMMKVGGVLGVVIVVLTIGLFPRFATTLYHVMFWPLVAEGVTFLVLMAGSIVYLETWDTWRDRKPRHLAFGVLTAVAGVVAAFIINAANAFMLTPGEYFTTRRLADAVFNPVMPSSFVHLLIPCFIHGGGVLFLYGLWRKGKGGGDAEVSDVAMRLGGGVAAVGILLQPFSGLTFLHTVSGANAAAYQGIVGGPVAGFFYPMVVLGIVAFLLALLYLAVGRPWRKAALAVALSAAFLAFPFGGYTRERARKPYLIYGAMFMNQQTVARRGEERATPTGTAQPGGKEVYAAHECSACHRLGGRGSHVGPALDRVGTEFSPEDLRAFLRKPDSDRMPAFSGSDAELDALVRYLLGRK